VKPTKKKYLKNLSSFKYINHGKDYCLQVQNLQSGKKQKKEPQIQKENQAPLK